MNNLEKKAFKILISIAQPKPTFDYIFKKYINSSHKRFGLVLKYTLLIPTILTLIFAFATTYDTETFKYGFPILLIISTVLICMTILVTKPIIRNIPLAEIYPESHLNKLKILSKTYNNTPIEFKTDIDYKKVLDILIEKNMCETDLENFNSFIETKMVHSKIKWIDIAKSKQVHYRNLFDLIQFITKDDILLFSGEKRKSLIELIINNFIKGKRPNKDQDKETELKHKNMDSKFNDWKTKMLEEKRESFNFIA